MIEPTNESPEGLNGESVRTAIVHGSAATGCGLHDVRENRSAGVARLKTDLSPEALSLLKALNSHVQSEYPWGEASAALGPLSTAWRTHLPDRQPLVHELVLHRAERENRAVWPLLVACGLDVEERSDQGETALWVAVKSKNVDAVRGLLAAGAHPRGANAYGQEPMMALAFIFSALWSDAVTEIAECLTRSGAVLHTTGCSPIPRSSVLVQLLDLAFPKTILSGHSKARQQLQEWAKIEHAQAWREIDPLLGRSALEMALERCPPGAHQSRILAGLHAFLLHEALSEATAKVNPVKEGPVPRSERSRL